MKTRFIIIISTLLISTNIFAQGLLLDWVAGFGGANAGGGGKTITVDNDGNVYTLGNFFGTMDFDPGIGVSNLSSNGPSNEFITKFDNSGNLIWARRIGANSNQYGQFIAIDPFGNLYHVGSFSGTVDFDPGSGIFNLSSNGINDIFISKLDSSGYFIWAKSIGGIDSDMATSVDIDNEGNVCLTGTFSETADFDPNIGIHNITSNGSSDIFVLKLSSTGDMIYAYNFGGDTGDNIGKSITIDASHNVYVAGTFCDTVDFDPDPFGVYNLNETHGTIFILKLDNSGNFVWSINIGGNATWLNSCSSLSVDDSENVYLTGEFTDTMDFDPGPGVYNLISLFYIDIYISKFDENGNFDFVKSVRSENFMVSNASNSISIDNSGNIYTIGAFQIVADFDPDPIGIDYLTSNGLYDIFISKLDSFGNHVWAQNFGSNSFDEGTSITVDNAGNVFSTGYFENTVDFDPNSGICNLTSNPINFPNPFILKLKTCYETSSTLEIFSCKNYISPSGDSLTNSGVYIDTIANAAGCDSIITLDLTIYNVDTSVFQNGNTLSANANGAIYQWIDCGNGNIPIAGATNKIFIPTANGSYAVIITENGCTDTSSCYIINTVSISENDFDSGVKVYPNPANEKIHIDFETFYPKGTVEIINNSGQLLIEKNFANQKTIELDIKKLPAGEYFVRKVVENKTIFVEKFVKE